MYGCTSNLEMYDPGEILRRFGWVEPVYKFVLIVSNSLFFFFNFSSFFFFFFFFPKLATEQIIIICKIVPADEY
jgi:hypothetical protein